ncbi:MAG TPA: sulfatase [Planctomycetota bacterium]
MERPQHPSPRRPRHWCLALLVAGASWACGRPPAPDLGTFEIERVVRDYMVEVDAWQVVAGRADAPPRIEVLCPAFSPAVDGVDMPALVMAPTSEVRLSLAVPPAGPGEGELRLIARAGVDQPVFGKLSAERPKGHFAFEVRAGERVLERRVVELVHGQRATNVWLDLGGPRGLVVEGLEELTLRTEALTPEGQPTELGKPLRIGFGGLRLVRSVPRARTPSSPQHPNIVLVLMDTLRTDRCSTYGYARETTPQLTRFARRGVLFESCYSTAAWTWPATASLFTGLTTMEHGLVGASSSFLFEQFTTLAETLQQAGFTTAAWSGNPIVSSRRNFDQGFELFHGSEAGDMRETAEFFEEIRAFLERERGKRFFLYLHLTDPHTPHRPLDEGARLLAPDVPREFRTKADGLWRATDEGQGVLPGGALDLDPIASPEERRWTEELYDASVWSGDHWFGRLQDELARLGLEDETIVAFVSDHGEELFERGFFGHGHSLRQELVRAPLVVAGPGVPAGKRNSALFSSRQLGPLLARLAGVEFGDGARALRVLQEGTSAEEHLLFTTTRGWWKGRDQVRLVGVTDGRWKLNLALDGAPWGATEPAPGGDVELFDLAQDPLERKDLSAAQPEVAARYKALLLEQLETLEARQIGPDIPAGPSTLHMLEQLGYGGGHGEEHPPDEPTPPDGG